MTEIITRIKRKIKQELQEAIMDEARRIDDGDGIINSFVEHSDEYYAIGEAETIEDAIAATHKAMDSVLSRLDEPTMPEWVIANVLDEWEGEKE